MSLFASSTVIDIFERLVQEGITLLESFYLSDQFLEKLEIAFGSKVDKITGSEWLSQISNKFPSFEILPSLKLNGAHGAFSGQLNTVYVSHEYILENLNSPQNIIDVILEELGHFIDYQLGGEDAEGDEGAIFSSLIQSRTIDSRTLAELKAEDDTAIISLESGDVLVEMQLISPGQYESSSFSELVADIQSANATPEDDIITIKGDIAVSSLPAITSNITFIGGFNEGDSSGKFSISGNGENQLFRVNGGQVNFSNLKLEDGFRRGGDDIPEFNLFGGGFAAGAAIFIDAGNVSATNVDFLNNIAQGGNISVPIAFAGTANGGAVYIDSGASFTVTDSSFIGNRAIGGITTFASEQGTLVEGIAQGGAIYVRSGATLVLDEDSVRFEDNRTISNRPNTGNQINHIFPGPFEQIEKRPVILLPGIVGSFVNDVAGDEVREWALNRGLAPDELQIDPFANTYDDLIQTFINSGYVLDQDLFVVPYDWRLPIAPTDSSQDGIISGLSPDSLVDNTFEYGVDYLGVALQKASLAWQARFPNSPLNSVDIVAHSMGGLVARSYIQSTAYGQDANGITLPTVNNLIMLGTPNDGSPKAWNPLNDDWNSDFIYQTFISKLANLSYQKVLQGETIAGPVPINLNTITRQGNPESRASKRAFIQQYVPSLISLLPTTSFGADIPSDLQNTLLQDLNADPDLAADRSLVSIIYGTGLDTITSVQDLSGPKVLGFDNANFPIYEQSLLSFTDLFSDRADFFQTWWEEISSQEGDGTVPNSSVTFIDAQRKISLNGVEHTNLPSDVAAQEAILDILGASGSISTGERGPTWDGIQQLLWYNFVLDPVDGFLIDNQGRRLGYSQATGPLTEIPNSIWFGNGDGIGWIFGDLPSLPTLEISGLGESYYVQVSGFQNGEEVGAEISGDFLAQGEKITLEISVFDEDTPQPGSFEFSAATYSVNEDGTPSGLPIQINRVNGSDGAVSVTVQLTDDTAVAPDDYDNTPIVVDFADGETVKTIVVPITDDAQLEALEQLNLELVNPTGGAAIGGAATAALQILDNEVLQPGNFEFSAATYTVNEDGTPDGLPIQINRVNGSDGAVSVTVQLTDDTAIAPDDYDNTPIVVDFADGETVKTVVVPIVDDVQLEALEQLNLELVNPTGGAAVGGAATAALQILDNDFVNRISGNAENNSLVGTDAVDIITGVDPTSQTPGRQEVDILTGNGGGDTFVLGDGVKVFYDDISRRSPGTTDYAIITDFSIVEGDVIQLTGQADFYTLGNVQPGTIAGTGIFLDAGQRRSELIGILQDVSIASFEAGFSFV